MKRHIHMSANQLRTLWLLQFWQGVISRAEKKNEVLGGKKNEDLKSGSLDGL